MTDQDQTGLSASLAVDGEHPERERVLLWSPSQDEIENSNMRDFQRWLERHRDVHTREYKELHQWSISDLDGFWSAIWEYFDVRASIQPEGNGGALRHEAMPGAAWFPDVKLNYAENLLKHAATRPHDIAIVGEHEKLPTTSLSWGELEAQVASLAAELRRLGVRRGDTVVGVLPHIPQTIIALLATASIGAVWSVVNTDFGITGIRDRLAQLEPKVLLTVDGYDFGGKFRDQSEVLPRLRKALPTVKHWIVVDQYPVTKERQTDDIQYFSEIIQHPAASEYEPVAFDHPLWVLYSSGTTGTPKGIVHSHGGVLLEGLKANGLHYDLGATDRAYFAVSTTWVVWNMLVNTMSAGASIITYDGAPSYGGPGRHFELIARHRATFFGTGAAVLSMIEKSGIWPMDEYDLRSLRAMMVTGSALPDSTWDWVYEAVASDIRVGSDSGGTDVATAFIGSNPLEAVYRGELMGPCLGVAAEAWDAKGHRVLNQVGELVITRPMPSMPIYFWNDTDGSRYRDAYFNVYPGVWRHGDWVTELEGHQFTIQGRSDSTINRGGIRMGSADITRVVNTVNGVAASMVIGAELDDGEYFMPLFVVPEPGHTVESLRESIVQAIKEEVSPRYVPDEILEAPGVPMTRTGKLMEVPVKKLFQGVPGSELNRDAVEDPAVLDWYAKAAERYHARASSK